MEKWKQNNGLLDRVQLDWTVLFVKYSSYMLVMAEQIIGIFIILPSHQPLTLLTILLHTQM